MAERKTERIMNLFFALLSTNQYLSKEQIREAIPDYRESTQDAFERKFERDKNELRALGITVESGSFDGYFDDAVGYRIQRDDVEMPDLAFSREEAAVLTLAARVWDHEGMAGSSAMALTKLRTIGVSTDASAVQLSEPRISANEPAFDAVWEATASRVEIAFAYQPSGQPAQRRLVQPWRVQLWHGRWYVLGHDLGREAPRLFRLDRFIGSVEEMSGPAAYTVPADLDSHEVARTLYPAEPTEPATLRIAAGRAQSLRRRAEGDPDADEITVKYANAVAFSQEVASFGDDVLVLAPQELIDEVIARLTETLRVAG